LGDGVSAPMRLDKSKHNITSFFAQPVGFIEHAIGLAHSGGAAQIDLETPILRLR
jgi:hypothetical protein